MLWSSFIPMNQREGRKGGREVKRKHSHSVLFCVLLCCGKRVCVFLQRRGEEDFTVKERGYLEERKRKRVFFQ